MKKTDLTEGKDYAYASYEYARRERVTLVKIDDKSTKGSRYPYRVSKEHLFRKADGTLFHGTSRELRSTWEAEELRREAAQERAAAIKSEAAHARALRNEAARQADEIFSLLGSTERPHWVPQGGRERVEDIVVHLADLGWHVIADERGEFSTHYHVLAHDESVVSALVSGSPIQFTLAEISTLHDSVAAYI